MIDAQRRKLLFAVAASATALGAGLGWWRWMDHSASSPPLTASGATPVPGFWDLTWETPVGSHIAMKDFQGKPLLLNFWATWCPPCVEELPLLNAFYAEHRAAGWAVLGLAVDRLEPVQSFLKKLPLDFPTGMAGMAGSELGRALGNLSGGLPFSVVVGRDGQVVQRKMGRLNPADLAQWARLK